MSLMPGAPAGRFGLTPEPLFNHSPGRRSTGSARPGPDGLRLPFAAQLREDVGRQARPTYQLGELLHRREAVVGDLLLADLQEGRHVAVGPALDPEQLHHLEAEVVPLLLPAAQDLAQA